MKTEHCTPNKSLNQNLLHGSKKVILYRAMKKLWLDKDKMLNGILFQRNGVLPKKENWKDLMVVCNGIGCNLVAEDTNEQIWLDICKMGLSYSLSKRVL